MIIAATQYSTGGSINLPLYDYTGTAPKLYTDGDGNWELVFTGDCDITFRRLLTNVDFFLVGGGQSGKAGRGNLSEAVGGNGGKGGKVKNVYNHTLEIGRTYQVRIGASDSATSAFGQTAATGSGTATGQGAIHSTVSQQRTAATAGADGQMAWGTANTLHLPGYKYAADGGGGSAFSTLGGNEAAAASGGYGWVNPTTGAHQRAGGSGGSNKAGGKGATNSGGGGGGGGSHHWNTATETNYAGGKGGSGIVKMRNAR